MAQEGLHLDVVAGKAARTSLRVDEGIVFGRQTDGHGRLANDPELSRRHAEISRGPGGEFVLADLGSMNGTYVNGVRVEDPVVLATGDIIDLGTTRLVVRAAPDGVTAVPPVDVRATTVVVSAVSKVPEPAPAASEPSEPAASAASAASEPSLPEPAPALPEPAVSEPSLPAPPPILAAEPPPPPVELRLSVDVFQGEIEIEIDGEAVRVRREDRRWRIVR